MTRLHDQSVSGRLVLLRQIDVDRYVGCAVFDAAFGACLKTAIRNRLAPNANGPISFVRMAFAADRPCGLDILEVRLASQRAAEP